MDAQTWAFIDRMNSFYPPEAIDWPLETNRAVYDRMSRAFHMGRPRGVTVSDEAIAAEGRQLPIRSYQWAKPDTSAIVLYLHGGGFILGGLDSHDDICAELCAGVGYEVVSVDYRLVPEHRGLDALEDAAAAFDWLSGTRAKPVVLVGESAGGTLAAALAHQGRRSVSAPAGQVLIYPSLGGTAPRASLELHADAPLLSARELAFYRAVRGNAETRDDPRYEPLADKDFSDLPPTVVVTAQCDPLSSDGELYRDSIQAAGGLAMWHEAPGLPHGFLRGRASITRAAQAWGLIQSAVAALGQRQWPYG